MNRSLWAACTEGHAHWGPLGAAGLLVARGGEVLLQLRPRWVHRGGTWSIPGGAVEPSESPVEAALREAVEELGLDLEDVAVRGSRVATCGGWPYETVLAEPTPGAGLRLHDRSESAGHRWVPASDVDALRLHPAFRLAWGDPDGVLLDFVTATG